MRYRLSTGDHRQVCCCTQRTLGLEEALHDKLEEGEASWEFSCHPLAWPQQEMDPRKLRIVIRGAMVSILYSRAAENKAFHAACILHQESSRGDHIGSIALFSLFPRQFSSASSGTRRRPAISGTITSAYSTGDHAAGSCLAPEHDTRLYDRAFAGGLPFLRLAPRFEGYHGPHPLFIIVCSLT